VRFREPQLSDHLSTADSVSRVADRLGVAPGAVAIAWTLRNPAVDGAIVGLRRPDQVDELLAGATLELSDEDVAELERRQR
jgi:aryl-alcohol dehydrogenase-like predicted oxidoreductase